MFGNRLPQKAGYCKSKCTLKKIFGWVGGAYPHNNTIKTFVLVLVNKHDPRSATALLKIFTQNNWLWGDDIDFFFPGFKNPLSNTPDLKLNVLDFAKSVKELENMSKWRYSGNTEFLFLEFKNCEISFEHTLSLYIDQLLQNHTISSIPVLIEDIIKASKSCTQVSEFANQLGYLGVSESVKDLS